MLDFIVMKMSNVNHEKSCCTRLDYQPLFREMSPRSIKPTIASVIIRVITTFDDRVAGVQFVYHENDYRPHWTKRSLIYYQLIIKITIFEKGRIVKL